MPLLRGVFLGSVSLHRALGPWPPAILVLWLLVTKVQEPSFFLRQGISFYWANVQAVLLVGLGMLPLLWRLGDGQEAGRWIVHRSRSPLAATAASTLPVIAYGVSLTVVGVLAAFTVDRMMGRGSGPVDAMRVLASSLAFLCCIASLTPFLLRVRTSATVLVCLWLLVLAGGVLWLKPRDLLDYESGRLMADSALVLQTVTGGWLLSLAAVYKPTS